MWAMRDEREVDNSREEIANGIALLDDATSETTKLDGKVFESCRGCEAPNATHRNTEERANGQKLVVGLHETGRQRKTAA